VCDNDPDGLLKIIEGGRQNPRSHAHPGRVPIRSLRSAAHCKTASIPLWSPDWQIMERTMLEMIAWVSLASALASALIIAVDEFRRPQKMWIMNVVWPLTALYFSIFAVMVYFLHRSSDDPRRMEKMSQTEMAEHQRQRKEEGRRNPSRHQIALADSHCGAGCALGDIITEFAIFALGVTLFGSDLWASYLWDFNVAWTLGIAFQYFTIKPMRDLSSLQALWTAIKADTFSILAFQVGMYLWMGLVFFRLFPHPHLHPNQPAFELAPEKYTQAKSTSAPLPSGANNEVEAVYLDSALFSASHRGCGPAGPSSDKNCVAFANRSCYRRPRTPCWTRRRKSKSAFPGANLGS